MNSYAPILEVSVIKRLKNLIAVGLFGSALALGAIGLAAVPAYAGTGHQWENNNGQYLNAWGGGPLVESENTQTLNNDFTIETNSDGDLSLVSTGGSGSYDNCIADYQDSSTNAHAAVQSFCQPGYAVPWGANLTETDSPCGAGLDAFYDAHWGGYLGAADDGNGSEFYLNVPATETGEICFIARAAY
jgi:hypothetical protein